MIVEYLIYAVLAVFGFFMFAHNPILPMIYVSRLPVPNKGKIFASFMNAWFRNLLTIIPDLLAPVVVPIALIFTKWEDNHLPKLFKWWDNDVTINGDRSDRWENGFPVVPLEDTPEARALAYWVDGKHHPRSFYARWIWMGTRNRASMLSMMLGNKEDYLEPREMLWEEGTNYLMKVKDRYRFMFMKKLVGKIHIRIHYGFKIGWIGAHGGPIAIGFSLRRVKS